MPSSGARSGTRPSRPKPAGDGRVGPTQLTCGHAYAGGTILTTTVGGRRRQRYWCAHCSRYRGKK